MLTLSDWQRLGEPQLQPAQVRLRSATGDGVGVLGGIVVRGQVLRAGSGGTSSGGGPSNQVSVLQRCS